MGSDTYLRFGQAIAADSVLTLSSAQSGLSGGVWQLSAAVTALQVEMELAGLPTGKAYLAIANYERGAWDVGPLDGLTTSLPLDQQKHVSPAGNHYFAVILPGAGEVTVRRFELIFNPNPPVIVRESASTGAGATVARVNGRPAIAFSEDNLAQSKKELRYARALDAEGKTWNASIVIDSGAGTGSNPSMWIVDGRPAIAYFKSSPARLMYVRSLDVAGSAWSAPKLVCSLDSFVNQQTSLAIIGGNPAIVFGARLPGVGEGIAYVRATDVLGSTWGPPRRIVTQTTNFVSDLVEVAGRPAITYSSEAGRVIYLRASDTSGSTWPTSGQAIGPQFNPGQANAGNLCIINGLPAVACAGTFNGGIYYLRALDAAGQSWSAPVVLSANEGANGRMQLAIVKGTPMICFAAPGADLCLATGKDINGTAWHGPWALERGGVSLGGRPLLEAGNVAGMAYKYGNGQLRFVGFGSLISGAP
jgi:hypothetical protein